MSQSGSASPQGVLQPDPGTVAGAPGAIAGADPGGLADRSSGLGPPAAPGSSFRPFRRMVRWGLAGLILITVLLGLTLSAVRYLIWPSLDDWRPRLESLLSDQLEARVSIDALEPGFQGWRPMLAVHRLTVTVGGSQPELSFERAHAVMSIRALLRGRFELARLEIDGAALKAERLEPRRWLLGGMLVDLDRTDARAGSWAWLLATRELSLRGLRVDWVDRVGGGVHRLDGIELLASREAGRHQAALKVPRLASLAADLDLRLDATLASGRSPLDLRQWRGEWHARVGSVDLARLGQEFSRALRQPAWTSALRAGQGPLMIWSEFGDGEWRDVLVKARAEGLDLVAGGRPLPVRAVEVEARARRGLGDLIEVEIDRLNATDGAALAIELDDRPQRVLLDSAQLMPVEVALSSRGFDAGALLAAAQRLPLPHAWRAPLAQWRATGRIESVGFAWRARPDQADFQLRLDLQRLGLRSLARAVPGQAGLPSVSNLSGRIEIDPTGGRAWLDSRQAILRFPGVFPQPSFNLATLDGELVWRHPEFESWGTTDAVAGTGAADQASTGEARRHIQRQGALTGFELDVVSLRFANPDLAGQVSGRYRYSGSGPGVADLRGELNRATASRVARYLPLAVGEATRAWVTRSVRAGKTEEGRFVLRGDLKHFPFRDPAQGEFLVETRLVGGRLQFAPAWPAIEAIDAGLRFERAGLSIAADRAQVSGVGVSGVLARIDDFRNPELKISGRAQGRADGMLEFLRNSPVAARLDPAVLEFELAADAELSLAIELPLGAVREDVRYRGSVEVSEGRLMLAPDLPPLESVSATIGFANEQFRVEAIRARLLGGPAEASARLGPKGRLRVEGRGRADAVALERWLSGRESGLIRGDAAYRLALDTGSDGLSLNIDSDLQGLASRLPAPLAKAPGESWPLQLEWRRTRTDAGPLEELRARLRGEFLLETERRRNPDSGRFEQVRGSLSLGSRAERLDRGFSLAAHLPYFNVDDWQAALTALAARPSGMPVSGGATTDLPRVDRISLSADTLAWAGRLFGRSALLGQRRGERWRFTAQGEQLEGLIDWEPPDRSGSSGAVIARFSRLEIPAGVANDRGAPAAQPPDGGLPALDVEADRLVVSGRALGSLRLNAVNVGTGDGAFWRLDRLQLVHPGGQLSASGAWRPAETTSGLGPTAARPGAASPASASASGSARSSGTELDFRLALSDPGRVLSTFGIQGALSGGVGALSGRLAWEGSPLSIHYPSVSGWLDIELGRGQFLKTEPGLAKLIGVLNLQSLPRRLSLDFRDVFAEGFAFDEIRGAASLASGVARTDAFTMRGVQALVEIRGEADLTAETQHLNIRVRPEFNAGLASLAYAAMANPAVGLGSFLAQLALRKPLRDIFSYEYEVKGSWSDPAVIERARPRIDVPQP